MPSVPSTGEVNMKPELCSVKVAVRLRPCSSGEGQEAVKQRESDLTLNVEEAQVVVGRNKLFSFDQVFGPNSSQSEVYGYVSPLVHRFLDGFNATIFAYGQTGSGKTFTMGTGTSAASCDEAKWGILPRLVSQLFHLLKSRRDLSDYQLKCSYVEIYNEEIRDLLNPEANPRSIFLREDAKGEIFLSGVKEIQVKEMKEMIDLCIQGSLERKVGNTTMNESSSRSHAIFTIQFHRHRPPSNFSSATPSSEKAPICSKFHLVDLAGSERLKKTGAVGMRLKESVTINSGLLALGNVINALSEGKKRSIHVPYRDSKLTRMLQNSLGGNSQTVMIACISHSFVDSNETLNTLKYASRARSIKNQIFLNQNVNSNDVNSLKAQLMLLHQQMMKIKSNSGAYANLVSNKSRDAELLKEVSSLKKQNEKLLDQYNRLQAIFKNSQSELKKVSHNLLSTTSEKNMFREKLLKTNQEIWNLLKSLPAWSSNSAPNLVLNPDLLISSLKHHFTNLVESKTQMDHHNKQAKTKFNGDRESKPFESKLKLFHRFRSSPSTRAQSNKCDHAWENPFQSCNSKGNESRISISQDKPIPDKQYEKSIAMLQEKLAKYEKCLQEKDKELREAREDLKKDEWIFQNKANEMKVLNSKMRQLISEREKYDLKCKTYTNMIFKLEQEVFAKDEEIKRLRNRLESDDESSHGFFTDGSF